MNSEPMFFELFVPAQRGLKAEVLRFNLNDPRDVNIWHCLTKAHTQPWRPETNIGDWLEDKAHENGNYQCICLHCRRFFIGHKRRVTCKECSRPKHDHNETRLHGAEGGDSEAGSGLLSKQQEPGH